MLRNVELALEGRTARADALLDTGATYSVIPDFAARQLGLHQSRRIGTELVQTVLGRRSTMDRYRIDRMRVGTAQAYATDILVGEAVLGLMLIERSFIGRFTTTLDLDGRRILFRPRASH